MSTSSQTYWQTASQEPHSSDSYLSDRSFKGILERWGVQVAASSYRGATGLSSWTTSLFCLHGFTSLSFINMAFHITAMLMTLNSTSHTILMIAAHISACLIDISCWMKDHHLQLNLAKTELLVVSSHPSFHHNFTFQLGTSTITPSKTARNLGVMVDGQLTFSDQFAKTTRSCSFSLFNIKKIRPFLSEHASQLFHKLLFCTVGLCN